MKAVFGRPRILWALRGSPQGLTCSQMCRLLNGKVMSFCYSCVDYGNMWKRKRGILKTPDCQLRKGAVWYRLRQLLKLGKVQDRREKRPDKFMSRGWDYMNVYYLKAGFA